MLLLSSKGSPATASDIVSGVAGRASLWRMSRAGESAFTSSIVLNMNRIPRKDYFDLVQRHHLQETLSFI